MNYAFPPPHALNIFESMKSNYKLSKKSYKNNFKSLHWDVFPKDYEKIFENENLWKSFLRNHISIGLNDALIEISNKRFENLNNGYWNQLKKSDANLLDKVASSYHKINFVNLTVNYLLANFESTTLLNNLMEDIGDPEVVALEIQNPDKSKLHLPVNFHDIMEIYYFIHFQNIIQELNKIDQPVIVEIGAGYGGIASKVKKSLENAKYIIFDLPEVNAVQLYYLTNVFPDKKILGYDEYLKSKDILKESFDFLILPGWEIDNLKPNSVDSFINMRSMMEMDYNIIEFYMNAIQKSGKNKSFFVNVNRYQKQDIKFKDYPYDQNWKVINSINSIVQNHIHILITQRSNKNENFNIKKTFKGINYENE